MTSPLRRKRPITAWKITANRIRPRNQLVCRVTAVCLAATILLICNAASAQELPVADSSTSQYLPPVHIPPRVPLHDPGLPQSLNGKFNSTHHIRSDEMDSGQRVVIGDVGEPFEFNPNSTITDSYGQQQFHATGNPYGDSVNNRTRGRRRPGLQDRLSNLIARNGEQPVGTGAIRATAQYNNSPQTSIPQSIADAVNSYSTQRRNPAASGSPPNRANSQVPRQQSVMRDHRYADYLVPSPSVSQSTRFASQPIPVAGVNLFSDRDSSIQIAALQQSDESQPELIEQIQGTVNELDGPPDQLLRTSSADSGNTQPQREQDDFPSAENRLQKSRPVSIMRKPDNALRVDAETELDNAIEFDAADSTEIDGFEEPETSESESWSPAGENVLRDSNSRQDEPETLRLSVPESDADQLESSFEDEDTDDDDSKNPLDKSCEEFRTELLKRPITEIALDMSPPAKTDILGENQFRVWRDQNGNELTQGTIADLRRGYVIINSGSGQVRIPYARLSDLDWLAISEFWNLPIECGLGGGQFAGRCWTPQSVTWHASSLCHKPLYFEDIQLERYGHSHGPFLQPVASTAHFFTRLFFLPYNTAINPPNECQYALGFYRPGNCAPWLRDPIPISLAGAARQSAFILGVGSFTQ